MSIMNATFFDTDMYIHKLSSDQPVRECAEKEFLENKPSAMSEFSIVEFKGNYIACLILLRRKINDSDSLESASSRIQNSGGRKANLMLAQLFKWLGGTNFPINPWDKAQNILLTYLDSQIQIVWEMFLKSVDKIEKQFNCTRAKEEPQDNNGKWSATIPKCRESNTNCKIHKFIISFSKEIENLNINLNNIPHEKKTKELEKIHEVTKKIIEKKMFPWIGSTCRQVGDLLIGLESKFGVGLLSSNYREHSILSESLGYTFKHFEVSKIRSK
ncbi:MAG: hypothetical protein K8R79_02930 [Calditrichales bacterium]|nr:hypothetical protein [Calditrichales bacterium]